MDTSNIDAVATLRSLNVLIEKMESVLSEAGDKMIDRCSSEDHRGLVLFPLCSFICVQLHPSSAGRLVSFTAAASPQMVLGPDGNGSILPVEGVLASVFKEINTFLHSRKCAQADFYQYVVCQEPQEQTSPQLHHLCGCANGRYPYAEGFGL